MKTENRLYCWWASVAEKQNQDTVALSTAEAKYVVLPVLNKSVFGKKKIKKKKKKKNPL